MKLLLSPILALVLMIAFHANAAPANSPATLEVTAPVEVTATDGGLAAEKAAFEMMNNKDIAKPDATTSVLATKEADIPVILETQQKVAGPEGSLFKIILTLSVLGVLCAGGYFFFKKYVRTNGTQSNAKQIKILTQHYLGPKKSLAIIRVAGESILIGITEQNISLIKELSLLDEEIPEQTPKSFGKLFERHNAQAEFNNPEEDENKDEFSISGIKDFVATKMKNMRSIE